MTKMPRPVRLRALDYLTALLVEIKPANGFFNDLSVKNSVIRGRLFIGKDEPVPMVSLVEPPAAIEGIKSQADNTSRSGEWDILLQGWIDDDRFHPTDKAYCLAAEVIMQLAKEKAKPPVPGTGGARNYLGLGDRVSELRVGAPVIRPPDETSAKACFYLMLTLVISEDMSKPFS